MSIPSQVATPFDYHLRTAGWATVTVCLSAETLSFPVSYIHDSLRELALALRALDRGAMEVSVCFIEEPGVNHMLVRRIDDVRIDLEFWHSDSWIIHWPGVPDDSWELRGQGTVRWRTFRGAVVSALQRIWREFGAEGYRARWKASPFPIEELRELEKNTT